MIEIVVVGGGIIGCAAAARLAEAGARVTLFEATELGAGASGRNSGSVQHPFDPVLAHLHHETVRIYRELDGFPMSATPRGLLLLTDDPAAALDRVDELRAGYPDLDARLLDERATQAAEPMLAPDLSAISLATGHPVPPDAAVRAFARRATAAGARLEVDRPVAAISVDGGHVQGVRLADGTSLTVDAVLLAAGPWTPELVDPGGSWLPIRRTWGVTVQVTLPSAPRHILEEGVVHTVNRVADVADDGADAAGAVDLLSTFSLVSVGDVSTVGSTFLASAPNPAIVAPLLLERGARLLPALRGASVHQNRICARPQSIDGRPLVGWVPGVEGLAIAAGHGPWGISTGPSTAQMAADLLLGRDSKIPAELNPARFGPVHALSSGAIHPRRG